MKFKINKEVLKKFPNMYIAIPIIKGFKNSNNKEAVKELMEESEAYLTQQFKDSKEFAEHIDIKSYFECFRKFGANPKKIRPTHFALGKRVIEGGHLPDVNPIVNVYNAFSIKYVTPFGGENLDHVYGDFVLSLAKGDEHWVGIGEEKAKSPKQGDLIWGDDYDISTLSLNWRQCERTKLDEKTTNGYFIMDGFRGVNDDNIIKVAKEFSEFIVKHFGGEYEILELDANHPDAEIEFTSKSMEGVKKPVVKVSADGAETKTGSKGIRKRRMESMGLVAKKDLGVELSGLVSETLKGAEYEGAVTLDLSARPELADYSSNYAMQRGKSAGKNPREYAEQIISTLKSESKLDTIFSEISIAGPGFINFKLSDKFLKENLYKAVNLGDEFTKEDVGEGKKILVESPSWNPNKAPHVGHLLNMLLGQTLKRLVENAGFNAIGDDIDNDKGLPVMQTIWAYLKNGENNTPIDMEMASDSFVEQYYLMGKKEYDASEEVQEEIKEILRKWERGDKEIREAWVKLIGWARKGHADLFELYGEIRDLYEWHESEVYEGGKEIVKNAVGKGVIEKLDDGALIARIEEEYGLPDTIVLKRDGSGLYHTQDINLTIKKKEKFNNPWMLVWVVGEDQIVHFQRLFSILDAMHIMPIDNLYHFPYGWVVGKDGKKLSSRNGVELNARGLYEMAFDKAKIAISERNDSLSDSETNEVARAVALGAIKYFMLSHDPFKTIKFDLDDALSFSGRSGPYVMYSYTRAQNVLGNIEVGDVDGNSAENYEGVELTDYDRALLLKLLQYPKVIVDSVNTLYPGLLADYLYDLAKLFSSFYENVSVKDGTDKEKSMRKDMLELFATVIKAGLEVLGIGVLERM